MNKRVLVVEDDEKACNALIRLLALKDIKAVCAGTFEQAKDFIQVEQFNLAIVDLGLPDSAPMDTLKRIDELRSKHTLIFTGIDEPTVIRECQRLNIRFILKGTSATGILREVLLALEWSEPSKEIETAIIDHAKNGIPNKWGKFRGWMAANVISVLLVIFVTLDHWGGWWGGVKGGIINDLALRNQVSANTELIEQEKVNREASEKIQAAINQEFLGSLKEVRVDLSSIHENLAMSKGQRDDILNQIGGIRNTTDQMYKYLLEHRN